MPCYRKQTKNMPRKTTSSKGRDFIIQMLFKDIGNKNFNIFNILLNLVMSTYCEIKHAVDRLFVPLPLAPSSAFHILKP